jgi:signal transduction histidine kinase
MVISLGGLIVVQSYLLNYAFKIKEQAFDRNVMAALSSTVQKLETREVASGVFHVGAATEDDSLSSNYKMEFVMIDSDSLCSDSLSWIDDRSPGLVRLENDSVIYAVNDPQHVTLQVYDPVSKQSKTLVDTFKLPGQYSISYKFSKNSDQQFMLRYRTGNTSEVYSFPDSGKPIILKSPSQSGEKRRMITAVIDQMAMAEWEPIEKRVDQQVLDSLLLASLTESGIDLDPAYGVLLDNQDSIPIIKNAAYSEAVKESDFKTQLFPHDYFENNASLALFFPGRQAYLWKQMGPLMAASIIFMVIIILSFAYTIYTIVAQKRFAGLLVNFINNMTHEFKTPISTVSLASEAISRPDVIADKEKVSRYNNMIQSENRRMRGQVEKILQMAVLEEGDYELKLEDVDVHRVIEKAVASIALQVENRQGHVDCSLAAENPIIKADAVHLENIINNILDNANKYSFQNPQIRVSTQNQDHGIMVSIEDNGMGISEKDKKQVFEKYYRVASGNLHDVKGFGLGLSYVRLMVEAHGGKISLESKEGRGTAVKIYFPFDAEADK